MNVRSTLRICLWVLCTKARKQEDTDVFGDENYTDINENTCREKLLIINLFAPYYRTGTRNNKSTTPLF
jgi:hypothetical protein